MNKTTLEKLKEEVNKLTEDDCDSFALVTIGKEATEITINFSAWCRFNIINALAKGISEVSGTKKDA